MMKRLDFILVIVTVVILGLLGILSLYGTIYAYFAAMANPDWTQSMAYIAYIDRMNAMALPLTIALIAVMSICLPKRFLSVRMLLLSGLAVLLTAAVLWLVSGIDTAVALLLVITSLAQLVVVVMTLRSSSKLNFLHRAQLARIGSALLHFGVVLFILDIAVLEGGPATMLAYMIDIVFWGMTLFWTSSLLIVGGMALAFYHTELDSLIRRFRGQA